MENSDFENVSDRLTESQKNGGKTWFLSLKKEVLHSEELRVKVYHSRQSL